MSIQPYQIKVYMQARKTGSTQTQASALAGISDRSGQRIEAGEHQVDRGRKRDWRTRCDPLDGVWESELEPMLRQEPRLQPTTLYEYLQEQYPGQYAQVLRTLQRRVSDWKQRHGQTPEVMFELRHEPGLMGLSDFTELKGLSITIGGEPYPHLIYHYRLAYSGWQYAQIIEGGESFIALSEGLQNAFEACGGVPRQHRTDSLSAAYRNAGSNHKQLTQLYEHLCEHYRLEPTRNNRGIAHENGAIESPHGHLKNRLTQQLYLRGSFEFASVADYQACIAGVVSKLNNQCAEKYAQERSHLQALPRYRVADYEVLSAQVSSRSTITVRRILYTVPSRLIGRQLEIHLYHNRLRGYLGQNSVVELPRVRATGGLRRGRCINYRHVIEALHQKPRAFIYCTWQAELLPNQLYRALWAQMKQDFALDKAALLMVEALYIAATQDKETAVADYLEDQLTGSTLSLNGLRQHFSAGDKTSNPPLSYHQHSLDDYDHLLHSPQLSQPVSNPESSSQESPAVPHAQPLGGP
ncbi:IS21 family transposase [Nodosilinea sp. P-1105]|nr:IS21 family transposase [Nodosilinea sp. P-1105]